MFPHPHLGDLIDVLDTVLRPTVDDWDVLAVHHRVEDRGALAEAVFDPDLNVLAARLGVMARWPPDPRVTRGLAQLWALPQFRSVHERWVWRLVAKLMVRAPDTRLEPVLRQHLTGLRDILWSTQATFFRNQLGQVITEIDRLGRYDPLTDEQEALCLAIRRAMPVPLSAAPQVEQDLLGRVYQSPDSTAARQVLADVLAQRGDPRGEFINLQLAPPTPERAARVRALLDDHSAVLHGPLAPVLDPSGTVFEGGFPVDVRVLSASRSDQEGLLGHPAWGTVHTLRVSKSPQNRPWQPLILDNPGATSLTRVLNLPWDWSRELFGGRPRRLRWVGVQGLVGDDHPYRRVDALPEVETIEIATVGSQVEALLEGDAAERAQRVVLGLHHAANTARWLEVASAGPLRELGVRFAGWALTFERGRGGWHLVAEPAGHRGGWPDLLSQALAPLRPQDIAGVDLRWQGRDAGLQRQVQRLT